MSLLPHHDSRRERDCVSVCVLVVRRTHSPANRHACGWLVGWCVSNRRRQKAEAGTRLDRPQISLSALEQLGVRVD